MNKKLLLLCVLFLQFSLSSILTAQTELIKDINPDGGWSNIEYLFEIGNVVYFNARNGADVELWRSDGTTAGTTMVKEINPGSDSADPANFIELNGNWIFTANDGTLGVELWITDGTEAGTNLLKDVNPTFYSSNPGDLTKVGNFVYFTATTQANGKELWITDGTSAGTKLVLDIYSGAMSAAPIELIDINGLLYFSANEPSFGYELWRSDGTVAGTQMVKDIMVGINPSSPTNLTNVDGKLFFAASNSANGRELWQSDGTLAGTVMVDDIKPGFSSSSPEKLTSIGNKLFFTADDGVNGLEFWWTDGSVTMPNLVVENIYPGQDSSSPVSFYAGTNFLYFVASDGSSSLELWRSDGTVGGTFLLKDINPGFNSSNIKIIEEVGNTLYFEAYESTHGVELWKTDGSSANTVLVKDINPGAEFSNPLNFKSNGDYLYFTAFEPEKLWQVWRTNHLTNETFVVTELPSEEFNGGLYKPQYIKRNGDTIYVVHYGIGVGEEYWRFIPEEFGIDTLFTNSPLACNGDETGTISVGVSGGLGADNQLVYEWNDGGMTGSSLSNLPAGTYSLTITDCGGNTVVASTTIEEATALLVNSENVSDANCNEAATGTINLTIGGGTPDYSYNWSNNATTNMLTGLAAGDYILTVTDDNNCTLVESFSVDEPDAINVTAVETAAVSCFGEMDGQATANSSGGMASHSYLWPNGMTTTTVSNLAQGTYVVTVTDANNCTNTASVDITQPDELTATTTEDSPAACGGGSLGAATVVPDGGTGNYQYLWDNNVTTSSTNSLTAGNHSVTITDGNNCTHVASIEISEMALLITGVDANDISCLGAEDGQVSISVTGNPNDYSFIWDNGETTASVSDLTIGSYMITVTNTTNDCQQIQTVNISGSSADIALDNQISCFGQSDGQASVTITNGNGIYNYLWTSNETNATANSLSVGTNMVTVTDEIDCISVLSIDITEPDELILMGSMTAATGTNADGTATVNPSGGTGDYTYSWNTNPVQNTQTITDLIAGDYVVVVTDDNGCTASITVTVDMIVGVSGIVGLEDFQIMPNPTTGKTLVRLGFSSLQNVQLELFDPIGQRLMYQEAKSTLSRQFEFDFSSFANGVYYLKLKVNEAYIYRKIIVSKP